MPDYSPDSRSAILGISVKDYVERIFEEKDKLSTSQRLTLELALVEARTTTATAMNEAKATVEARLIEAKVAADAVQAGNVKRLDHLESGGAPFASRLDESLNTLKDDVDALKDNMVKTTVLDALREKTDLDALAQKRQIRTLTITVGATVLLALGNILFGVFNSSPDPFTNPAPTITATP